MDFFLDIFVFLLRWFFVVFGICFAWWAVCEVDSQRRLDRVGRKRKDS